MQQALGANLQGAFASLAARLNFYLPDTAPPSNVAGFVNATTVSVPGTQHQLGSGQIIWKVWDAQPVRNAVEPQNFTIESGTLNVVMTFAVAQSGTLMLDAPPTRYEHTFASTTGFTLNGTTHGLGTADLVWSFYNSLNPKAALSPQSLTIDPTSFTVVVTFATAQAGTLVLSPGRTAYATTFAPTTQLLIQGSTHNLGSAALVWALYTNATPRAMVIPGGVTVDPVNFDVTVTFAVAQGGRFVLAAVATPPVSPLTMTQALRRTPVAYPIPLLMTSLQTLEARIAAIEEVLTQPPTQETPGC